MNLTPERMYSALVEKDSSFEGIFYVGVKTTGIFCRPSCTARKPKFENVEFFQKTKDAIANGYRPCKVCKPLEQTGQTPEYIKNILNKLSENPFLKIKDYDLIQEGIEPNKVRRWFKNNHGITFQGYQRMIRINSAYNDLLRGKKIPETAFDSGYKSLSGFNDAFKNIIGDSPSTAKYTNIINICKFPTPLGPMYACANEDGIILLEFTDRRMLETELKDITRIFKAKIIHGENTYFSELIKQMNEYFEGIRKEFNLNLLIKGTEFQTKVWKQLQTIPYGKTRSYKEQAIAIENPKAVRAVAGANGLNRLCIIIPCHRVIGNDGTMTGYGGGVWRKKWLLDFEKENLNK